MVRAGEFSILKPLRWIALSAAVMLASPAAADRAPAEMDGLVRVQSQHFDAAYLAPGASFSGYNKIMLDATEAAFAQHWQSDYNSTTIGTQDRITDQEAREILANVQTGLHQALAEAYSAAGYQVVTELGPDVLRVRTGIANLSVAAPDQMTAGRSATFSRDAGEATLVIEARDSMSGALLARGFDRRTMDDEFRMQRRTSVSNRSDFERTFRSWANMSVQAFTALRETPAQAAAGAP